MVADHMPVEIRLARCPRGRSRWFEPNFLAPGRHREAAPTFEQQQQLVLIEHDQPVAVVFGLIVF